MENERRKMESRGAGGGRRGREEGQRRFLPFSEVFDRLASLMNLGLWSRRSASQAVKHVTPRHSNDCVVAVGPSRRRAWFAGESPCCGLGVRLGFCLSTGLRSIPRPCLRCGSEPSWRFVRTLCEAFRGPLLAFGPCCYRACVVVHRPLGCSLGFREKLFGGLC